MYTTDEIYAVGFTTFFAVPLLAYLTLLAAGRVTMPPSKARGAGRRIFGPFFIGYYYWMMTPIFRAAEASGLKPDQVTLISAGAAAATAVAIATGHFALASALLIGGSSLDMVDGHLARAKNLATPGGAFLDSTIDRLCDGLIFAGCVVYYSGTLMMYVALVALITCYLVSYARARSESLGLYGAEGLAQRADRIVLLGIAMAFSPVVADRQEGFVTHQHYWVTAVTICGLAIVNTATAASRIAWTRRHLALETVAPKFPERERVTVMLVPSDGGHLATEGLATRGRNTA